MPDAEARAFTARLPEHEYEALKAYAFFTGATLSDVVVRAVRQFLAEHGGGSAIDNAVDETRKRYKETIERLAGS